MTLAPDWMDAEETRRAWMDAHSLYRAEDEHSSCGVGLVVSIEGKPSRKVVEHGIEALKAVWHRGAVDADGKTGDGAGIHVQIPVPFFYDQVRRTGHEPDMDKLIAVGQVFLPRTDFAAQERCRTIVETEVLRMGHYIYGWRHVPVNTAVLGDKANATRPEIEQILIRCEKDIDDEAFERELYIIRRRIERAAIAARGEYRPPENDDEPEVATTAAKGTTAGQVARNATVGGMELGRTQVIGVIGAGRASRGLIRLRNGKVVTVRLGDRIDGGAINSIGNGRISYVKGGRQFNLPILNGR